ncbi:hypothetical protein ACFL6C_05180 [Myxococcota bacterium]
MRALLAVMTLCLGSPVALAQPTNPPIDRVVYKNRTVIDIDGVEIEGTVERPRMTTIRVRGLSVFIPMLELRANFVPELLDSAADL